jgi:hypothetical protein
MEDTTYSLSNDRPIRLRGHHLTSILTILTGIEKNIFVEVYGEKHAEYVNGMRQRLLSNPYTQIEIVKGHDDICSQCRLLEGCKKDYSYSSNKYEDAYRKFTHDYDTELYSSNLDVADVEELKKIDKRFITKDAIRKFTTKLGLRKFSTYAFIDLIRMYEYNNKKQIK